MRVNKNIGILFISTVLVFYILVSPYMNVQAQKNGPFEIELVYKKGMRVTLETPWYVNSSSSFNVTLVICAKHADLLNVTIKVVNIISFVNESKYHLPVPSPIEINELKYGTNYTESFEIILPQNVSKIVMGEIDCSWVVPPDSEENQRTMFPIAVIADYWRQRAQDLQNKLNWYEEQYAQLNQTYHELEDKYNKKMGQLDATQRLSVIFGITTALFAFTTFYLFRRKPQLW